MPDFDRRLRADDDVRFSARRHARIMESLRDADPIDAHAEFPVGPPRPSRRWHRLLAPPGLAAAVLIGLALWPRGPAAGPVSVAVRPPAATRPITLAIGIPTAAVWNVESSWVPPTPDAARVGVPIGVQDYARLFFDHVDRACSIARHPA